MLLKKGFRKEEAVFAKNITYLRLLKGYSQETLSKLLGYKSGAIVSYWEAGKAVPPNSKLEKLAAMLSCSVDDLMHKDIQARDLQRKNGTAPAPLSVRINVYASVHAGIPNIAIDEVVDFEDIPADWTTSGREYFAVKVRGNSMEPEYRDGDTVIVQKSPTCDSGDDCIVRIDGDESFLRRVIKSDLTTVILKPLNGSYSPMVFTGSPAEPPISIIGIVRELRRRRR